jgi:serine/threonine protein kinase
VGERIGRGGYGDVYLGRYQGCEVAVKVISERPGGRNIINNALELAVLSTVSHPSIVQVSQVITHLWRTCLASGLYCVKRSVILQATPCTCLPLPITGMVYNASYTLHLLTLHKAWPAMHHALCAMQALLSLPIT